MLNSHHSQQPIVVLNSHSPFTSHLKISLPKKYPVIMEVILYSIKLWSNLTKLKEKYKTEASGLYFSSPIDLIKEPGNYSDNYKIRENK
jgi:hypothetical protein